MQTCELFVRKTSYFFLIANLIMPQAMQRGDELVCAVSVVPSQGCPSDWPWVAGEAAEAAAWWHGQGGADDAAPGRAQAAEGGEASGAGQVGLNGQIWSLSFFFFLHTRTHVISCCGLVFQKKKKKKDYGNQDTSAHKCGGITKTTTSSSKPKDWKSAPRRKPCSDSCLRTVSRTIVSEPGSWFS